MGCLKHNKLTGREIQTVALCGGAGSFLIPHAIRNQADVFITGEIKYHDYFGLDTEILLAEIGHYESEQYTKEIFYTIIRDLFPTLDIQMTKVNTNPINTCKAMAKEAKKDPQELTVEQKLKTLYQLQTTLSKIDEIKTLRGELPLEVQDLEDEIAGLSTRIERIKSEIAELKTSIAGKKVEIEAAKASVAKYKEQQDNVRNNREYDFLTKEIEFQTLEIELCEKESKSLLHRNRQRLLKRQKAQTPWKKERKTWK